MTIALDFGTCNTVIARWNEAAQTVQVPRLEGLSRRMTYRLPGGGEEREAFVIPSLIHFGEGDACRVGAQVENAGLTDHPGAFRWIKQDMLRNNTKSRRIHQRLITYPEAASELLNRLLLFYSGYLGGADEELILTVPVEAYDHYIHWMRETAAGVFTRSVQVVDEATACILGYLERARHDEVYVIVDFGGGTLDVSIVKTDFESGAQCKPMILGRAGEEAGGMLVDQWLLDYLAAAENLAPEDLTDINAALLRDLEQAKIALSNGFPQADITRFNDLTGSLITHTFTPAELHRILDEKGFLRLVGRTVDRALEAARDKYGVRKSAIKSVLLVGGTSLLLGVAQTVKNLFPDQEVRCDNPFEAIATGACRFAGQDFNATLVHDYCLKSWNRETMEFCLTPIIPKNTPYPTNGAICGKYINGACDGAAALSFIIYETSDMTRPISNIVMGLDGKPRIVRSGSEVFTRETQLNPNDRDFLHANPPCERGDSKRFIVGFGVDAAKRLTVSIKDTRPGNQSYIVTHRGEKIDLPVKDFPFVKL